jgi:very-short-patch-repair endonuclease
MSPLEDFVEARGGVVRTSALVAAGFGRALISRELEAGRLVRVRRGWVAHPDADSFRVAAARAGVVLTCVTWARRSGLWVLADERVHVAAPAHAGRVDTAGARVHRAIPLIPRRPDRLEDEPENALALVAACQPREVALAIFESALNKGVIDTASFGRLALPRAARRLLEEADALADSGLETLAVHRLGWLGVPLRRQVWIAGRPVDLLIGERLVLQIDGGHHVGAQREADIRHDAELMLRGYHVIRVGYAAMVHDWPAVERRITRAIAQGLHLAR